MIGPEGAAELAAAWLELRVPYRLAGIEARLELEGPARLGRPALVLPHDRLRLAVEEWPAILVVAQALRRLGPVEVRPEVGDVYRATYGLRVFAWVRDEDEAATDLRRKRYLLAIREALLERLTMTGAPLPSAGGIASPAITTDALSLAESYSDLVVDDAGATIAGAWLDVDVIVEERLDNAPVDLDGTPAPDPEPVELVDVTVTALPRDTAALPPHPAL